MRRSRYSLQELLFAGETREERQLNEERRVRKIMEEANFKLDGNLLIEGWFGDLFDKISNFFSDIFDWGDDDDSTDPSDWTPTKQQLAKALAVGGGKYLSLVDKSKAAAAGKGDGVEVGDEVWDEVRGILDEGTDSVDNIRTAISKIPEIRNFAKRTVSLYEGAVDNAFKMNAQFGNAMVKAVQATKVENFLPKPEKTEERFDRGLSVLFEQSIDKPAKKEEPAAPSKEALAAAEKKRTMIISKVTKTAEDVFKNRDMAEIQCTTLVAKVVMGPFGRLVRKVRKDRKAKWANKGDKATIKQGIKLAGRDVRDDLGLDENLLTGEKLKIGQMLNKAYLSGDPVKYYTAMIAAHKQSA